MTCRFALSLLADYIDNELAAPDAEALRNHLNTCPDCRAEYESGLRLKGLLARVPAPDPGTRYWEEVTPIILAKTVDQQEEQFERVAVARGGDQLRQSFTRALITCALSLTLLFSAVMIGRQYRPIRAQITPATAPMLVAASIHSFVGSDRKAIITPVEEENISLGSLLVGSPCSAGRFAGLFSLSHPQSPGGR